MQLRKLEDRFYEENTHLLEVMDKNTGVWDDNKTRGYGVLVIELNSLRFGIPLRSNIPSSSKHCFFSKKDPNDRKGLDFEKAVLLPKDEYVSALPFQIPRAELVKYRDNEYVIWKKFSKYVDRYVKLCTENPGSSVLKHEYRYSTLVNYHVELGIVVPVTAPALAPVA